MPWASTLTVASCGSVKRAPALVAATAASCEASTRSYSARCGPLNLPLAGKVRVMSLA